MKKLNNKGFTLVELLAVIAILIIIMMIALPNISSSIERTKSKQDAAVIKVIKTAGNLYVSDHKNNITETYCLNVSTLISEDYLDQEDVSDYQNYSLTYIKQNNRIELESLNETSCDQ